MENFGYNKSFFSQSFMEKFLNCSILGIKPTLVRGAALPTKEFISTKCCLQSVGLVTIMMLNITGVPGKRTGTIYRLYDSG